MLTGSYSAGNVMVVSASSYLSEKVHIIFRNSIGCNIHIKDGPHAYSMVSIVLC